MKRELFVTACVISVSLMTTVAMVAVASEHQTENITEISENKEVNNSLENIDSVLVQLMNASDKEQFAEQNAIDYRDGRVQVVVEMEENATFPETYNTTNQLNYTGQGMNLVQAYVPVDDLVSLSDETRVEYIRLPLDSAPGQETERDKQNEAKETGSSETNKSETSGNDELQEADETETQDVEGLGSVMGSIVATLIVILTAVYGRRKL